MAVNRSFTPKAPRTPDMKNTQFSHMLANDWIDPYQLYSFGRESSVFSHNLTAHQGSPIIDPNLSSPRSIVLYSGPATPDSDYSFAPSTSSSYFEQIPVTPASGQSLNHQRLSRSPPDSRRTPMESYIGLCEDASSHNWQTKTWYDNSCTRHLVTRQGKSGPTSVPMNTKSFGTLDSSAFSSFREPLGRYPDGIYSQCSWHGASDRELQPNANNSSSFASSFYNSSWDRNAQHTVNPSDTMNASISPQGGYLEARHPHQIVDSYLTQLDYGSVEDVSTSSFLPPTVVAEPERGRIPLPSELVGATSDYALEVGLGSNKRKPVFQEKARRTKKHLKEMSELSPVRLSGNKISFPTQLVPPKEHKKAHCRYPGCGAAFDRNEHCTRHEKMHTNERPFICSLALNSGTDWCNIQSERKGNKPAGPGGSRCNKKVGIGRSDNQLQHYLTHLKYRAPGKKPRNNRCADRTFLYWIIWRHERERAYRVYDMVEAQMKKRREKTNEPVVGEPDVELMMRHPEYPEFVAWREAGGTLKSLGYNEPDDYEEEDGLSESPRHHWKRH